MGECQSACHITTNDEARYEVEKSSPVEFNGQRFIISQSMSFQKQATFAKVEQAARAFCQKNNISALNIPLVSRIIAYRHEFIFEQIWKRLSESEREDFLEDLNSVSHDLMDCFYYHFVLKRLKSKEVRTKIFYIGLPKTTKDDQISSKEKEALMRYGTEMLKNGKVGVVLMCAGSSSRFQNEDKFLVQFNVGPFTCCILDLLLLRLKRNAAGNKDIPIIINCNQFNSQAIQKYIKSKDYFGLSPNKFRFNTIDSLAVFDMDGKYCINDKMRLIRRPSGTAACAQCLLSQGISNFLRNEGVQYVYFSGAENLLQNPADPIFLGIMLCQRRRMGAKCVSPIFQTESLPRYYNSAFNALKLDLLGYYQYYIGAEQQLNLVECKQLAFLPVAMNSMIFQFEWLSSIVTDFNHNLFLAEKYRVIARVQKVYNVKTSKPQLCGCYSFQKDIRDLISCVSDPILYKVNRGLEYAPICSKNDKYCLPMALDYYGQRLRSELQVQLS